MNELQKRFEAVSRGRTVRIADRPNTLFNYDYKFSYDEVTNSYCVEFTRNGWFEEAYRCIERWIKRHAEKLDGVYRDPPPESIDCRDETLFWILERCFDRCIEDCQAALEYQVAVLECEQPEEDIVGEVTVEARMGALRGVMAYLQTIADEVHTAVLSPRSTEFLRAIGLDPASRRRAANQALQPIADKSGSG